MAKVQQRQITISLQCC